MYEILKQSKATLTIPNVRRLNYLELFLDVRVKQTIEVEAIRAFFPTSQVRYFVPVNDVAFCAKLGKVRYFRVYGSEKKAGVGNGTVTDVGWTIVPSQADTGIDLFPFTFAFLDTFRWQEFHNACYGIGCTIPLGPSW